MNILGYQDWQLRGSAPGNPASGFVRMWIDNLTGRFKCLTSTGDASFFDTGASVASTPSKSSSSGTAGQISYDSLGNFYWCYATNSWARMGPNGFSMTFGAGFTALSRTGWTATADSIYGTGFEASKALDGSTSTYWLSGGGALPHWLYVDMGSAQTFNGVQYVPEQNANQPTTVEIYVSDDGSTWGSLVATSSFSGSAATQNIPIGVPVTHRYVKINITASDGTPYAGIAEFYVGSFA